MSESESDSAPGNGDEEDQDGGVGNDGTSVSGTSTSSLEAALADFNESFHSNQREQRQAWSRLSAEYARLARFDGASVAAWHASIHDHAHARPQGLYDGDFDKNETPTQASGSTDKGKRKAKKQPLDRAVKRRKRGSTTDADGDEIVTSGDFENPTAEPLPFAVWALEHVDGRQLELLLGLEFDHVPVAHRFSLSNLATALGLPSRLHLCLFFGSLLNTSERAVKSLRPAIEAAQEQEKQKVMHPRPDASSGSNVRQAAYMASAVLLRVYASALARR